jgi:Fic family protein
MTDRGVVIAFSGALGVYTGALSTVVAELLGWKRIRFSDFIREQAVASGENPDDIGVLQRLGQELVEEHSIHFVSAVLKLGGWTAGGNLVIDGLRHAQIHRELLKQVGSSADLRVVHIAKGDRARRADRAKRAEGLTDGQFDLYEKDITEAEVEETPAYANLALDWNRPRGELAKTIVSRFVPAHVGPVLTDDGESVSRMEPLVIGTALSILAKDLLHEAQSFAAEIPAGLAQPLAELVRAMNCYYSNKIEGHNATPIEIDRALSGSYESDPRKRHLQAEAHAHIAVQRWIDAGGLSDQPVTMGRSLMIIHDRFFSELPDVQWIENNNSTRKECIIPGNFRRFQTEVGRHVPPSPGAIPRFMIRFEQIYSNLEAPETAILGAAAAHHRLLWIHPFGDGNGRVARLMSDAMLSKTLHTHSIWSVSRGLALSGDRYKQLLADCDLPRRNDFDGRGNLSEESLVRFTSFFLTICIDQVKFMRQHMRLAELRNHIDVWVKDRAAYDEPSAGDRGSVPRLHPEAGRVLKAVLDEGALKLSEAREALGSKVEADVVIRQLVDTGVVRQRGDNLTFFFPAHLAGRFLPGLFV